MRPVPILLTRNTGQVTDANVAARDLLGPHANARCSDHVRAEDGHGQRVCTGACSSHFVPGVQHDHGVVSVRGQTVRMLCTAMTDQRVVTLFPAPAADHGAVEISPREREVLTLVSRGLTSGRIARRLSLSTSTVRTHVEHIRDKLGVRTRSQAVAKALAMGMIE